MTVPHIFVPCPSLSAIPSPTTEPQFLSGIIGSKRGCPLFTPESNTQTTESELWLIWVRSLKSSTHSCCSPLYSSNRNPVNTRPLRNSANWSEQPNNLVRESLFAYTKNTVLSGNVKIESSLKRISRIRRESINLFCWVPISSAAEILIQISYQSLRSVGNSSRLSVHNAFRRAILIFSILRKRASFLGFPLRNSSVAYLCNFSKSLFSFPWGM